MTTQLNERVDDYVKGAAKEIGKKAAKGAAAVGGAVSKAASDAREAGSKVVQAGKEVIDSGRSASFDKDLQSGVNTILGLIRDRESITLEGITDIAYGELLMEMDIDRELVEAATQYQMFLNEESELNEAWMDFIRGAGAEAKKKLAGATKGAREKAKAMADQAGKKVKQAWDKTKEVYKEIDAAGKQASASGDAARTLKQEETAKAKRRAAVEKKQAEVDAKINKAATRVALAIQRREKSLGKPIQMHPTITSMIKGIKMNSIERKKVMSAISAARRNLK